MRLSALVPLSLLLLAAARPSAVPVYRDFGDWTVTCDNTRACEARGFSQVGPAADLRVLRAAGDTRPSVVLSAAADVPVDGAAVRLDGTPLPLRPPAWTRDPASPGNPATLAADDPDAVRAFLLAARGGHVLQIGAGDGGVPLDGLTAALLFIDAVQGRPGSAAPLAAPSGSGQPLPPSPLPRAPAWVVPPALTAGETRSVLARARALPSPASEDCDATDGPDAYPLDAASALVLRPCAHYAYQSSSLVYILPRHGAGPAGPVALPVPGLPGKKPDLQGPDMVGASFDPATGELSTAVKGRGPGDCGLMAGWVWHAGAFRLTRLTFQDACGGAGPGDFPTLYRTTGGP